MSKIRFEYWVTDNSGVVTLPNMERYYKAKKKNAK